MTTAPPTKTPEGNAEVANLSDSDVLLWQPDEDGWDRTMKATKVAQSPQAAWPLTDALGEAQTMRGLWFGLLIAVPFWLIVALLLTALF